MNPKYIFSAVFAVASLLSFVLPQLSNAPVKTENPPPVISPYSAPENQRPDAPTQVASVSNFEPAANQALNQSPNIITEQQVASPVTAEQASGIPLTAYDQSAALAGLPDLTTFVSSVVNAQPGLLVGVYAPGLFAMPVVQQPAGNNDYISSIDYTLTQYGAPAQYGSTAILAHNYLSGRSFFQLQSGQDIVLVYGDGSLQRFRVAVIARYQALSSTNPYSDFIDLDDPSGSVQPFSQIFERFYTSPNQLVFQTCIEANGDASWGRIFIVASPF